MYTKPGNNPSCSDMFKRKAHDFPTPPATSTQLLFQGEDVCAHQRFSFGKGGRACGHADDAEDQIWIFRSFTYACRVVG